MDKKDLKLLFSLPVIVAALGYFVDIYDLLLFSIVRRPSLITLGVPEDQLLSQGEFLLQAQMSGLLIGGIIWGVMGDKRGRLSVLFGSILLYSLANIANGFVTTVGQYATMRFIAGVGLAGELGAGITLVSEILPTRIRGYATALIASVGITGAILANFVARIFEWHVAFFIGGGLGLLLLLARISVFESGMFLKMKSVKVQRGNFFQLFRKKSTFVRYVGCILIGLPIWYVAGILITFSPEFGAALNISGAINAGDAVMFHYMGLALGDFSSGFISQKAGSRKKIVAGYVLLTLVTVVLYLSMPVKTTDFFYAVCFLLGIAIGYWALFITIAAEQFGTNLRSTVATTVPNFIRGTVVPLTFLFGILRHVISQYFTDSRGAEQAQNMGIVYGALILGVVTIVIALGALKMIDETFGKDLNFEEH